MRFYFDFNLIYWEGVALSRATTFWVFTACTYTMYMHAYSLYTWHLSFTICLSRWNYKSHSMDGVRDPRRRRAELELSSISLKAYALWFQNRGSKTGETVMPYLLRHWFFSQVCYKGQFFSEGNSTLPMIYIT